MTTSAAPGTTAAPPSIDDPDLTLSAMSDDPFPFYRRLHQRGSVHWFPALDRFLVIGYEACRQVESAPELYLSDDPSSLQRKVMGHSMIRKDGEAHAYERRSFGSVLKPRAIESTWNAMFAETTREALQAFVRLGPGADLHRDFATPLAGESLRRLIGLANATAADMSRWSQDLIAASGNYTDRPELWRAADRSNAEIDEAIREMQRRLRAEPDDSLLQHVLAYGMSLEQVSANVKLAIVGGLNEPRDLIGTIVWALLADPAQHDRALADPARWADVFEEGLRWVAPLAMYVRTTARDTVLDGYNLPAGSNLAVTVGAANRDPSRWTDPDRFDIDRKRLPHLGFGNGPHFCAGSWVARALVRDHALPALFAALPGLRLDPDTPPMSGGWVFRGPLRLPVLWNR